VKTFTCHLLALGALLAGAAPLAAQTASEVPAGGSVVGTVVAAATGQPIPNAVVVLESASDVSVVSPGSGAFLSRSLVAVTDETGAYRFGSLHPGTYRLVVRHLGFHPAAVDVQLAQEAPFRVSVGLVVNPIQLEAVDTRAPVGGTYARNRSAADDLRYGLLDAEQARNDRFLEGDAAVLTHAEVTEAVTLGETDLFRAIQRLPGVSTRDDYTAALWTRGAPWSETRVYFDGLPLFNPVHAIGVFAGVNPDAVGAASFHPGVRPVAIGEGAAGVLNVTSRRASRPGFSGLGELSVISARGAGDWGSPGGRTSGMLAVRRSYVDLITRLAETFGADSGTYIPYSFYDVTGRFDADLGHGIGFEASGLWEEDDIHGDVPGLLKATRGHWGNRLGRATLSVPLGGVRARTTVGVSDFSGRLGPAATPLDVAAPGLPVPEHALTRNDVGVFILRSDLAPADAGTRPTWTAGIQMALHSQNYLGQYPRPYPVVVLPDTLSLRERLPVVAAWGERRWSLGRRAAMEAGLRVETHRPVRNAPSVGFAPKLAFRVTPPVLGITFTAALERSWQYTQALAPAGPSIGPDLYVTDVWLAASDTIPAVRADVATVGAEMWIGAGWTASANLYGRRATGVAEPEPSPGPLDSQRPIFVQAENRAHGIELSLRKLVGRWTGAVSYSYGHSNLRAASGYWFNHNVYTWPSSADRRHSVDATAFYRVTPSLRLGAAFTAATGAPFSRFLLGVAPCDSTLATQCPPADTAALEIDQPNAVRAPAYASLDLLVDWSRTLASGVRIGAFLQVRNVLNRNNAVTYAGSIEQCTAPNPPTLVATARTGVCDQFDRGVPILPLAGVRIAF